MSVTVALVYDLKDDYLAAGFSPEQAAEFDSEETIGAIAKALRSLGYAVDRIGNAHALVRALAAGRRWDLVFNIAEGLQGRSREAQVPGLLEIYDIPYTFSDPLVCAAATDKAVTKTLVRAHGLNTPDYCVVRAPADADKVRLKLPLFAKPLCEGTGKGIGAQSKIRSRAQLKSVCSDLLRRFRQPVLVEEFLPGREFTTGLLGTGRRSRVLGTIEVVIAREAGDIYSYTVKRDYEKWVRYRRVPDARLRKRIEALALAVYRALDARDAARIDIRLDAAGEPSFIEINPLPGLHHVHSDLPILARQQGMSFRALIGAIVASALERAPRR